ncbi:MAG: hypothetical protein LBV50_03450 [Novosphingobium sp.]|jgi:uncharacterized membrane protein|nr:hypothetical protein [Novosphingobium sp.]
MSDTDQPGQPAPQATPPASTSGFDLNHPTIISLLYISSTVLGITGLVGLVLAYVWKGEAHAEWETSHYEYLIRTFWIGLIGMVVSIVLMIVLIGFLLMLAVGVLVVVRCVLSLINAQKQQPMPNPGTWLA